MPRTVWSIFGSKSRSIFSRRRCTSTSTTLVVVDVGQDHGLRDQLARVAHQVLEEGQLLGPQVDLAAGAPHLARQEIELEVTDLESGRLRRSRGAAHEGLHPRQELGKGEGLHQVVVAARLQATHAVVDGVPGAQEEDGSAHAAASQLLDEGEALEPGQHHVHDRDVVRSGEGPLEARGAFRSPIDREARFLQALGHEAGDGVVVLDDQDAHGRIVSQA
jgi:hypothetical protein